MTRVLFLLAIATLTLPLYAGQPVKDDYIWKARPWADFKEHGLTLPIVTQDLVLQTEAVKVQNDDAAGKTITVFDLPNPGITHTNHRLDVKLRHEDVQKGAYLELWTYLSDGSHFFTRTLADSGPLQKISGTGSVSTRWLPFSNNSGKRPTRLKLNVVFEGKGTVFLGPTTLEQSGDIIAIAYGEMTAAQEKEIWASKPWKDLPGRVPEVELVRDDALKNEVLKIANASGGPKTVQFLEITDPEMALASYRFDFELRYENVENVAFIEMWTYFDNNQKALARTMADLGPQQKLAGTSAPRKASLIQFNNSNNRPQRIVFNLVFNGNGAVWIGPSRFAQFGNDLPPKIVRASNKTAEADGFWNEQAATKIGMIAGIALGCAGALVGLLTYMGRAKRMVYALLVLMLASGVLCLVTGAATLANAQPAHIFYPLLLIGAISVLLPLALFNTVRGRYEDMEMERTAAS